MLENKRLVPYHKKGAAMPLWVAVLLALPGTIVGVITLGKWLGKSLHKCELMLYELLRKHLHK